MPSRTRTRLPGDDPDRNGHERDLAPGRFKHGNKCAVGRSPDRLSRVARECTTEDDLIAIMKAAIAKAKKGDERARRFVFEYVLGRPRTADACATIDLGNLDRKSVV